MHGESIGKSFIDLPFQNIESKPNKLLQSTLKNLIHESTLYALENQKKNRKEERTMIITVSEKQKRTVQTFRSRPPLARLQCRIN